MHHQREESKPDLMVSERQKKNMSESLQILSGDLSFKECVNILHYGRLIFKFLLTLKVSYNGNDHTTLGMRRDLAAIRSMRVSMQHLPIKGKMEDFTVRSHPERTI